MMGRSGYLKRLVSIENVRIVNRVEAKHRDDQMRIQERANATSERSNRLLSQGMAQFSMSSSLMLR
jgi:hypothetical protein